METQKKKNLSFPVIYQSAPEGGYVAWAPALPGCHTQGDTLEEAESNIKEAIALYLETLISRDERLPQETKLFQGTVEVEV
jgi:predicted RNase H-like HicB family nuclease